MAIHRGPRPTRNFTILGNDFLRDDRLSYRARGIHAYVLSHDEGWSVTSEELARLGKEGRDAIRTALTELEALGYIRRIKVRGSNGQVQTRTVVYDEPQPIEDEGLFPTPGTENQASVNQPPVSQAPIEDHSEDNLPSGGCAPKPKPPATLVAEAHYEHVNGMCNFLAIRGIATRALKVKGTTPEAVTAAMNGLYDQGRPITFQTVGQALARTNVRETNQNHWASGGQFQ